MLVYISHRCLSAAEATPVELTLVIHISWRATWMLLDNCCFQSVIPPLLDIFQNVTETASTLRISLFLYQLHWHFPWFSAFDPEITLLSFSLCTVLNVHALVFISSWAAPSCKGFLLEASHYRSVCCVLGLRNWLFHWGQLSLTAWGGDSFWLIFWIRICRCPAVIDKVYIITSSSTNRAELILEARKELKLSSVLSFLQLKAKTIAFWL